jgi:pyrroline-5-carboxylate reductase
MHRLLEVICMDRIGFLGCGNMGSAIARALSLKFDSVKLFFYDTDNKKSSVLAEELSGKVLNTAVEVVTQTDITILAVKPQILPSIYPILAAAKKDHQFISIAAGVTIETLCSGLNSKKIVRFMPNIAASVSSAVTAVAVSPESDIEFVHKAQEIAEACGTYYPLDESLFPAFIGISGSAIAFFYQFLHAVAMGGTLEGIPYPQSISIASETFSGALDLMKKTGTKPQELITSVSSAAGTTIEGLLALENGGFNAAVMQAVRAASQKAVYLEEKKA